MLISANEVIANLIKLGWFVLIFVVIWFIYLYEKQKGDGVKKDIDLEKVIEHDKLNQLSDADLLNLSNDTNKSSAGSPEYVPPAKKQ